VIRSGDTAEDYGIAVTIVDNSLGMRFAGPSNGLVCSDCSKENTHNRLDLSTEVVRTTAVEV